MRPLDQIRSSYFEKQGKTTKNKQLLDLWRSYIRDTGVNGKKITIFWTEDLESFHDDEDDEHDDNKQRQFLASILITSNK